MHIILIIILFVTWIILTFGLDIKLKDIKMIKQMSISKEMQDVNNKFPENRQICEEILSMLNNKETKIEELENKESQTCLYLVMQNKILLGNIKQSFVRVQTISHECIHSIQNKKLLKFNFIISNFNIFYFILICIFAIFKIVNMDVLNILLFILIMLQFVFFVVRSFLETDAMTRAEYVSAQYLSKLKDSKNISSFEESMIIGKYKDLNKIGIKLYNYTLASKVIIKILVYCFLLIFI